jgi:predicted RNase H-like HicB family nuclease
MERMINLQIEKLPEGVYLATSDDVQGLVAQGRTVSETIEIARDVARRLFEAKTEREGPISLPEVSDKFSYPLVIGT